MLACYYKCDDDDDDNDGYYYYFLYSWYYCLPKVKNKNVKRLLLHVVFIYSLIFVIIVGNCTTYKIMY